ncbi:MAG TPA: TonB-dependent receptor [Holophagaceae bacterium]|nr:TonB-dependent receptor [Holophagaceae bacterium]
MFSSRFRALPLILAAGATLSAQTTGTLQGRVVDSGKAPVVAATVRITGANLQGSRTLLTGDDGSYRFGLLPPGAYTITATKEGLNTAKVTAQVGLDKTATVDLVMAAVAGSTVEVVESVTNVDVKATTSGQNFTNETFQKLPTSRDFGNIALLAPGITDEPGLASNQAGFKVYGASAAENNYVVDGINTTGAEFGTQGKKIPVEFIQEFQIKTGGFEAEYGKATGGIVNVITKSGGNEFTGDVFAYWQPDSLRSGNSHKDDVTPRPQPTAYTDKDFGFDVGGYFIKDKLWFFVAYDRTLRNEDDKIPLGPTAGQTATRDTTRDLFAGKLTWKLTENQSLIASFLGDPQKDTGAVKQPIGPASTWDGIYRNGGTDYSLRYELSGNSWFLELQGSRHKETNSTLPSGDNGNQIQLIDNTLDAHFGGGTVGGFGRIDDKSFTRDNISGAFTKFINWSNGGMELKFGFDLQTDKADIKRSYSGGQQVTAYTKDPTDPNSSPGPYYYNHYYWTSPDYVLDTTTPANSYLPSILFTSQPKHESQAFFAQDKITIANNWVVNVGIRYDKTDIKDQFGDSKIKLSDEWAPRLGVIWDWRGKGQDKLYMSLARYYEQIPLDLVIRSFSSEINPSIYNYDPVGTVPAPSSNTFLPPSSVVGSYIEPVDPDLKGQYSDEFILGGETTVNNLYVLGAKYIRRYLGRAVEDALDVNSPVGDYFIMNPGSSQTGVQYPRAVRDYKAFELSAQRKFADHYYWQASYLWSKLEGNYEGAFQGIGGPDGLGQLDPNIDSAFDEPAFLVNNNGPLSGDRRHQFKANGYYEWDFGLSLGASFRYQSGTPITRLGNADTVLPFPYDGRWEVFLTPRGAEGTTPATSQLDLNLAYDLKMPGKNRLRFMLDIFNLLDSQKTVAVDQRYNKSGADVGQTNPYYLNGILFQTPRSIRVGVRYSF